MSPVESALVTSIVLLAATAVPFAFTTAVRHNDRAGRLWSGAPIAMMCAGSSVAIGFDEAAAEAPLLDAVLGPSAVITAGLLWAGMRVFRGTSAGSRTVLAVAAGSVALVLLPESLVPDDWGRLLSLLAAAGFTVGAVVEAARGPLARNMNTRLAYGHLAVLGLAFVVAGVAGLVDEEYLALPLTVQCGAVILCLMAFTAMRVERHGLWWSDDAETSGGTHGAVGPETFRTAAQDRLDRLASAGGHAGLVLASVVDLDAINDVFGRSAGDDAIARLADVVRSQVPAWSVIGHLGAGEFAALIPADASSQTLEVAEAVERRMALLRRGDSLPVGVTVAGVDTRTADHDLDALIRVARSTGPHRPAS